MACGVYQNNVDGVIKYIVIHRGFAYNTRREKLQQKNLLKQNFGWFSLIIFDMIIQIISSYLQLNFRSVVNSNLCVVKRIILFTT